MKLLYFDCFNGASTNLILSSLIDLGVSPRIIDEKLKNYEFEFLVVNREELDFPSTSADILVKNDKTLSMSEALELTKDIEDDTVRCLIISAISNLKQLKMSEYLKICACVFAYESLEPDFVMSSPITEGVGYENAEPVPSYEVLEIIKMNNIKYKISSCHKKMITSGGVSVIASIVKEYGIMPEMDILKIGYGNDGENYMRVILGTQKQKEALDFFEMSLDFDTESSSSFVCGEIK